ncbi:MAG: hypothetical protein U9R56_03705, partial [candidate division Zixibacteria bacterium]|nr:hypothetical protein [candidate division Zixibacteria bacterium]
VSCFKSVLEGDVLVINLSASDMDGGPPAITVDTLIENATFVDNLDGTAVFTFSPDYLQSGLFGITFEANDGVDFDREIVLVQVLEAGNQTPEFDSLPSGLTVDEADTLIDIVTAHDPEMDTIIFSFDTLTVPDNFIWVDSGNGVLSFTFMPDYIQSGIWDVDVIASDGDMSDTATITIDVIEMGNQLPVLDTILDTTTQEGVTLSFVVSATDVDGPPPLLTSSTLPGTAAFTDNFDGTGTFNWTPTYDDSGSYSVMFYATDVDFPTEIDSQAIMITVEDVNRAPWLTIPPSQQDTVAEGDTLTFSVIGWDMDGSTPDVVAVLDGTDSLATNMILETWLDSIDRHALLTFTPDYTQGSYPPTFYNLRFFVIDEFDTTLSQSQRITFRAYDKNKSPYIQFSSGTGPFDLMEGESLNFSVQALDDDGIATLTVENVPDSNCSIVQPTDDAIMFSFNPDFIQAGQYLISFIAVDNDMAADTQIVEINVSEAGNQAPVWSITLPDTTDVFVGILSETIVSAVDPEGEAVTLEATPVVTNATWDTTGGEGTYAFTPAAVQIDSVYEVLFIATDPTPIVDTMITHFRVLTSMRGDVDGNELYTINDVIFLAGYVFREGPDPNPLEAGDVDLSGTINVADVAYMVNYLYNFGPRPPQ